MKKKYRRMLAGLTDSPRSAREWSVYLVRCGDGSLYTGTAKDVEKRLAQHNTGRGAAYTRTHRPVRLVHREDGLTRSEALVREARIKSQPREKKELLISGKLIFSVKKRTISKLMLPIARLLAALSAPARAVPTSRIAAARSPPAGTSAKRAWGKPACFSQFFSRERFWQVSSTLQCGCSWVSPSIARSVR